MKSLCQIFRTLITGHFIFFFFRMLRNITRIRPVINRCLAMEPRYSGDFIHVSHVRKKNNYRNGHGPFFFSLPQIYSAEISRTAIGMNIRRLTTVKLKIGLIQRNFEI